MAKKQGNSSNTQSAEYPAILADSRTRFNSLVSALKNRGGLDQSLEFAIAKVAAELESLECLQKEILNPSSVDTSVEKRELGNASLGKLLPHFLVNLDKLGLQCGVELAGSNPRLISALFQKNREFTELLIAKS